MEKRVIKTNLVGKENVFKMLAVSEAIGTPLLLLGEPGVGKTQALLDYAASKYNYDRELVRKNAFVLELDEGTKTSEIKGRVNMKSLLEDKKYEIDAPIADAEFILINEVDKGTSGVRNTLLSVMREKALFYGDTIKKCKWSIFAGSCNVIPEDELENPFWDRFILVHKVERLTANDMKAVCAGKGKKVPDVLVHIPSKADIQAAALDISIFNKLVDCVFTLTTDRTIYALVDVMKAVKLVYSYSDKEAALHVCALIAPKAVVALAAKLETKKENNLSSLVLQFGDVLKASNDGYSIIFLRQIMAEINDLSSTAIYKNVCAVAKGTLKKTIHESSLPDDARTSLFEVLAETPIEVAEETSDTYYSEVEN